MKQTFTIWTGGRPESVREIQEKAKALPLLPAPAPLWCLAIIEYQWGDSRFEVLATACSVRITPWGRGQMTWLHCKARPTAEVRVGEPFSTYTVLIPAHYVTAIEPGPVFQASEGRRPEVLGLFPPNQPPPLNALPLEEVERVIVEVMAPAPEAS